MPSGASIRAVAGETVSEAGPGSTASVTVTVALAERSPVDTVTVVVPAPTASTNPVPSTAATPGADDDQASDTFERTLPSRSRTVAVNLTLPSGVSSWASSGETDSDAAAGGSAETGSDGLAGAEESPEQAYKRSTGRVASHGWRMRLRAVP